LSQGNEGRAAYPRARGHEKVLTGGQFEGITLGQIKDITLR
jgi:hypothetical protein